MTVMVFSMIQLTSPNEVTEAERRSLRGCTKPCYLNYFLGRKAPTGLEFHNPQTALTCLCQNLPSARRLPGYFGTLFDTKAGIAIFSAYVIDPQQARGIKPNQRPTAAWRRSPGIAKQGSDQLYAGHGTGPKGVHKGHLNPAKINSFDTNYAKATFSYTNAVPQYGSFNQGSWKKYEARIVKYVKATCGPMKGTMYLITGTSKYRLDVTKPQPTQATGPNPIALFPGPADPNAIVRPNSMWTAGCCVHLANRAVIGSIAVMGNNNYNAAQTGTTSMYLDQLEDLLVNTGKKPPNLFPAFPSCRKRTNGVLI